MTKLTQDKVLRYEKYPKGRRSQKTVKRYYIEWRSEQNPPIPTRCDEPSCVFHHSPLIWNEKELKLILDHKNGVCGDNRPENLQFLCPNCNSQQPTQGGGNRGKVEQSEGGFSKKRKDGKKDYTIPIEPGKIEVKGGQMTLTKGS